MNETIEKKPRTPQARLAAALLDADRLRAGVRPGGVTKHSFKIKGDEAATILAADPTIAADLTLAARLRDRTDPLLTRAMLTAPLGDIEALRAALTEGEK